MKKIKNVKTVENNVVDKLTTSRKPNEKQLPSKITVLICMITLEGWL